MSEFVIRTEELSDEDITNFYVETSNDRNTINKLKSPTPIVLVGSRGMGKSFLFKTAEIEMKKELTKEKIFPVYITFRKAPLLNSSTQDEFYYWMINKLCTTIIRALKKEGIIVGDNWAFGDISEQQTPKNIKALESINREFESSWKKSNSLIEVEKIPTIDELLDIIEDICDEFDLKRIVVFIDEAAHVFMPEQQRQFFTLFRELRSSKLKCNAAVYPGTTFYGDTFEPIHDATFVDLRRDIRDEHYIDEMKQMVLNQVNDSETQSMLLNRGAEFTVLAYAASGNPRILLKSINKAGKFNTKNIENDVFKEFYRSEIWSEHSSLTEKYNQREAYIDWGRKFIEEIVLPELKNKNDRFIADNKETTAYFWIHRNSPQEVFEALRILEYTGIIKLQAKGIKATGAEIGNRYEVNIGCLLSLENNPLKSAGIIIDNLALGRMSEYGKNSKYYSDLKGINDTLNDINITDMLKVVLCKPVNSLDLTPWQVDKLTSNSINTLEDLLNCTEERLLQIYQIGTRRASHLKNTAIAAIFEWLS